DPRFGPDLDRALRGLGSRDEALDRGVDLRDQQVGETLVDRARLERGPAAERGDEAEGDLRRRPRESGDALDADAARPHEGVSVGGGRPRQPVEDTHLADDAAGAEVPEDGVFGGGSAPVVAELDPNRAAIDDVAAVARLSGAEEASPFGERRGLEVGDEELALGGGERVERRGKACT